MLLTAMLLLGGYLAFSLYPIFPQRVQLFQLRHQHGQHLALHLDSYDFQPGDAMAVYLSVAPAGQVELRVYDVLRQDTLLTQAIEGNFHPLADSASVYGTGWQATDTLHLPAEVSSGWYVVEAQSRQQHTFTSLFIQPAPGQVQRRIAWLFSTNTWNAYNPWGGQSLYTVPLIPRVSFQRPQPLADPFLQPGLARHQMYFQGANKDRYLAQLLDSLGQAYDPYSMMALHRHDPRLADYDVLIMSTHSEYWTTEMLQHLNQLLDSGASLVNLAGNVAAYRSYLDPVASTLTVHKHPSELWPVLDSSGLRPFGTSMYLMGFHTYAPYQVQVDSSWLLAGTGLQRGDLFGQVSDTYDFTHMYDSPWEQLRSLLDRHQRGAASGLEIDKVYAGTPANWITVASGLNPPVEGHGEVYPDPAQPWSAGGGADLGYYRHPGGGVVFAASSMAFTGAIPYDPAIRQIIANVLTQSLAAN
jgi:N,N-dimethylformamidase